jgi:outer membrane lipoprotein-sorting protein
LADILGKLSETYKDQGPYELVKDTTLTNPATGKRETVHQLIAVKMPDRYRVEGAGPTMILDGANVWFYEPDLNQYASYPASALGHDLPDELEPSGVDFFTMSRYREAAKRVDLAKFLREDEIQVGPARVACYVVSMPIGGTGTDGYTWWIDKANSHVVREDFDGSSTIFTKVQLGNPLPDELFRFKPPPGARNNSGKPRVGG